VSRRPAIPVAFAALFAALTLISCSSGGGKSSPSEVLDAAKTRLDGTSGVHFKLAAAPLPPSGSALQAAEGDAAPPGSFTGTATVRSGSITATVKVISVGGKVYVQQPFSSGFTTVDPAKLGLVDPGALLSADQGVSTFLTAGRAARADGSTRVDGEVLDRYRAVLPTLALLSSSAADIPAEFDLVRGSHELRRVVLVGTFFDPGTTTTLTLTLTDYGKHVDVRAP
jgi:lipoprotein LprG